MKKFAKYFLIISFVITSLFLIHNFLFPFIYKIKEPCFEMPIELNNDVNSIEDLPIRYDLNGDGEFGAKRKGNRTHKGLDMAAKINSPVYAAKSGWGRSFYNLPGYGNLVIINHPGKWQTRYGHLDKITLNRFQWVRQGDIIGTVGKTGNANRQGIMPHLHFEIRYKGEPLDPLEFLTKEEKERR